MNEEQMEEPETQYIESYRATDFVQLHEQVQESVSLLDSFEQFLSTFQTDLAAVSGQISDLQGRSQNIDMRLRGRMKIEKPLSGLLSEIVIPPEIASLILDSPVDESWIPAIERFSKCLKALRLRPRVKAAKDILDMAEGLRIVAATKLRAFFRIQLQPLRASMSTNMQVLQAMALLKFNSLFVFLQLHASSVAQELQRTYAGIARTYYETGFRRYLRTITNLKTRTAEKSESIVSRPDIPDSGHEIDFQRLSNGSIEGAGVTLSYLADDRNYKETSESLFRSVILVLMDNATSEYYFLARFFFSDEPERDDGKPQTTPAFESPKDELEVASPMLSPSSTTPTVTMPTPAMGEKERQGRLDTLWKQVFDPVLTYIQTFLRGMIQPSPPVVSLLTMIRLLERVTKEVEVRQCRPSETFLFSLRLEMWPVFQKEMHMHVEALKKYADGSGGGYLSRSVVTDTGVRNVCSRYCAMFVAFITLTRDEEETVTFSNLLRLRQELYKLIIGQSSKIKDKSQAISYQSKLYDIILQSISSTLYPVTHPKAQSEVAFWREQAEEVHRRLNSQRR